MVRVHCDPPGRKPEWERSSNGKKSERMEARRRKPRKRSWPERVKVLPKAEAARQKPPRCEKALKEMNNLRERRSHRGESPKYLDNCTVN